MSSFYIQFNEIKLIYFYWIILKYKITRNTLVRFFFSIFDPGFAPGLSKRFLNYLVILFF